MYRISIQDLASQNKLSIEGYFDSQNINAEPLPEILNKVGEAIGGQDKWVDKAIRLSLLHISDYQPDLCDHDNNLFHDLNLEPSDFKEINFKIPYLNSERVAWFKSNLYRHEYIDQSLGEFPHETIFTHLEIAMEKEAKEIFELVLAFLQKQLIFIEASAILNEDEYSILLNWFKTNPKSFYVDSRVEISQKDKDKLRSLSQYLTAINSVLIGE